MVSLVSTHLAHFGVVPYCTETTLPQALPCQWGSRQPWRTFRPPCYSVLSLFPQQLE